VRPVALILAAAACAACGGTTVVVVQPPAAAPAAGSPRGVVVTADVLRVGSTVAVPLAPGQAIAQGDQVALDVDLEREAYVYVLYVDARGAISGLYPRTGHVRVPAGGQHLPALGRRWKTDDLRGEECFVVLASPAPLDEAIRRSRAEAWKPSRGPRPAATKVQTRRWLGPAASEGPETTGAMGSKYTRGPVEVADGIVAAPDPGGVATAVFRVDHRAR
jgi:hypothetical protein